MFPDRSSLVPPIRSRFRGWIARCWLFLALARSVAGATISDVELRMTFLVNFLRFTEWPAESLPGTADPLVLVIVGRDPFGGRIDSFLENEKIGSRPLVIQRAESVAAITNRAHAVYISRGTAFPAGSLQGRGILTIGEESGFAEEGGMIQVGIEKQRPVLEINRASAEAAGLKINARLLKLARRVFPEKDVP